MYRISHAPLRNLNTAYYEFPYYLFIRALSRTHLDVWSRIVKKFSKKKFFYDRQEKFRNLKLPVLLLTRRRVEIASDFKKNDRISFHGTVWGTEVSESPPIIIKGVGGRPAALVMADIKSENCVRRCELENPAIPLKKEKTENPDIIFLKDFFATKKIR